MKQVYFATRNRGKVNSVKRELAEHNIDVIHASLYLPEPRSNNLQEIAREKVQSAYAQLEQPCMALDSGFYMHAVKGFPGTFTNFALDTIGIEGMLKLIKGKSREGEFRNCLAYRDETCLEPVYFESVIKGRLAEQSMGEMREYYWSELFLVFVPDEKEKTLAEMSLEEYQDWRAQIYPDSYVSKFAEWFSKR